jgi:hypothetical protein
VACVQRTGEFLLTDELAYLWIRGTTEKSDVGAELDLKFYDPNGHVFSSLSNYSISFGSVHVLKGGGEIAIWMGIGIPKANVLNMSLGIVDFSGETVEVMRSYCLGAPLCSYSFGPGGFTTAKLSSKPGMGASELSGDWRAEFSVGGNIVVSERFMIGEKSPIDILTQPAAPGLPSSVILLAAAAVGSSIILLALHRKMRKRHERQPTSSMPALTKYCINCGASIPAYARYCPKCAAAQA